MTNSTRKSADPRKSTRRVIPVLISTALLLVATACGSKSSASSADTAGTAPSANQAAFQAYRDCMAQHGVNMPQRGQRGQGQADQGQGSSGPGGFGGTIPGVDQATMQAAQDACKDLRPSGGPGGGSGNPAFQAYASCMKDHGVAIPTRGQGSASSAPPSTIDRNSDAFKTANDACQALLPNTGAGGASDSGQGGGSSAGSSSN